MGRIDGSRYPYEYQDKSRGYFFKDTYEIPNVNFQGYAVWPGPKFCFVL